MNNPNVVPAAPWRTHIVQYGESLSGIAMRYGLTTEALAAANGISNPHLIYPGQVLTIPAPQPGTGRTHVVQFGDTLAGIANFFRVTMEAIMALNSLPNANAIYPGLVLRIPDSIPSGGRTYTVRYGDTLGGIANFFRVTVEALMALNGLMNPNLIYPGQVLRIPEAPQPIPTVPYVVQPGETLGVIAVRFGITLEALGALNGIFPPYTVFPGQTIRVPQTNNTEYTLYTVPPQGEPFFMIAQRFGITQEALAAANNMRPPYITSPGQVLRIPKKSGGTGRTHTVQTGENALTIIFKYNITLEALARANNLQPPYALRPGQVLQIP